MRSGVWHSLILWRVFHCEPVHAVAGDSGDADSLPAAPPFADVARFEARRPRADAAPAGVAGVAGFFRAENRGSHNGADAVGPDDCVGFIGVAVRETHARSGVEVFD